MWVRLFLCPLVLTVLKILSFGSLTRQFPPKGGHRHIEMKCLDIGIVWNVWRVVTMVVYATRASYCEAAVAVGQLLWLFPSSRRVLVDVDWAWSL